MWEVLFTENPNTDFFFFFLNWGFQEIELSVKRLMKWKPRDIQVINFLSVIFVFTKIEMIKYNENPEN